MFYRVAKDRGKTLCLVCCSRKNHFCNENKKNRHFHLFQTAHLSSCIWRFVRNGFRNRIRCNTWNYFCVKFPSLVKNHLNVMFLLCTVHSIGCFNLEILFLVELLGAAKKAKDFLSAWWLLCFSNVWDLLSFHVPFLIDDWRITLFV